MIKEEKPNISSFPPSQTEKGEVKKDGKLKNIFGALAGVFLVVLLIGITSSLIDLGGGSSEEDSVNFSLVESYSKGENIKGWMNMSFEDDLATNSFFMSFFNDSQGNEISLIDLLKIDERHEYNCTPENCKPDYNAKEDSAEEDKVFNLGEGNKVLIGFNLFGKNINSVESVSFNIKSNASESCKNQLKLDFFNDGEINYGNDNPSSNFCGGKNYGECYSSIAPEQEEYTLTNLPYCQRIKLPEAPGFKIGINVKNESGSGNISMSLFDLQGNEITFCEIEGSDIFNEVFYEKGCEIDYLVTEKKDYLICTEHNSGEEGYIIQGYSRENGCGFYGDPRFMEDYENLNFAYSIFYKRKEFSTLNNLEVNDSSTNGGDFSGFIQNYISEKYGNLDCSSRDCIVPIRIISGVNQIINFSDLDLRVDSSGGPVSINTFHNLTEEKVKIDSDYQKIYLDNGNFSVPNETGQYDFKLNFKGETLFSEQIEVKEGATVSSITPTKTAVNLSTTFKLDSDEDISIYKWDFGDGKSETTSRNFVEHKYSLSDNYTLSVETENSQGIINSKSFNIEVVSAKDLLEETILKKEESFSKIKEKLNDLIIFEQNLIKGYLNFESKKERVKDIKKNISFEEISEENARTFLLELRDIEVPSTISKSSSISSSEFFVDKENINLGLISSISGGNYTSDKKEKYEDAIHSWTMSGMSVQVEGSGFSLDYGNEKKSINIFKIETQKENSDEDVYFFVRELNNMGFGENLSYEEGHYYKELESSDKIYFYTSEDISTESLPVFFSKNLDSYSVSSAPSNVENSNKIIWFVLGIILLIGGGVAGYFFLGKWYKNKYEKQLFKSENDLYNLVTYVQNQKKKGKSNAEIKNRLLKSNWSREQVKYVLKKYSGKKPGIPGFK